MTRDRAGLKQICFDVPLETHKEIKRRANDHNMSIKEWILRAMAEKIKTEKELGWK